MICNAIQSIVICGCLLFPFQLIASSDCHTAPKLTPDLISKLEHYYNSGDYLSEIEKKVLEAKDYLDRRLKKRRYEKFAMVLDIDETSLSNYMLLKEHHFSTNMEAFAASYLFNKLEAVGPVLGLFHYAKKRGVDIFFITSRPNIPEVLAATVRNLKQTGYEGWKGLYLKPLEDNSLSTQTYKQKARQEIMNQGYTIVLNLGDQSTDLSGGLAEVAIKMPNPFYLNQGSMLG